MPCVFVVRAVSRRFDAQQVSFDRILHADREPQNWLSYSGTVFNQRYSPLTQIAPGQREEPGAAVDLAGASRSRSSKRRRWRWTACCTRCRARRCRAPIRSSRSTPTTGRPFWTLEYKPAPEARPVLRPRQPRPGHPRRHAVHGHHRRAPAGDRRQDRQDPLGHGEAGAGPSDKYAITHAPLVLKDKIIVGVAGGDRGVRAFIAAYDAKTGKELWRFYTIPGSRRAGQRDVVGRLVEDRRRRASGTAAPTMRTRTSCTSAPATRGPTGTAASRLGDNLYSDSVVALDPDTGQAEVALSVHAAR